MIGTCLRNECDNIFNMDSRENRNTCSKYCRALTRGSNSLKKKPKRKARLELEYANATRTSEIIKLKKEGWGTSEIFKESLKKIKARRK